MVLESFADVGKQPSKRVEHHQKRRPAIEPTAFDLNRTVAPADLFSLLEEGDAMAPVRQA